MKSISEEHVFVDNRAVHDVALFTFAAAWGGIGLAAVGVEGRSAT